MSPVLIFFFVLIFVAVFLLVQGLTVPAFGESAQMRKRLKSRLSQIEDESGEGSFVSLLRKTYLDQLSPTQRWLESLPGMETLRRMIEQAGMTVAAWQVVAFSALLSGIAMILGLLIVRSPFWALVMGAAGAIIPVFRVSMLRRARMDEFERELPDAIDLIKRALRAGQPFSTALRLAGEELDGPVGQEMRATSSDLSYGNDLRRALMGLLARMPSVALMGFVTAVLLQRETGGNLAEILQQISGVIRGRYRFQRRVRTLSAEGKMSAWVLTMVPVGLAGVLAIISPEYLPILFNSETGQKMLVFAAIMMVIGILWMRKIIRIEF